MYLESQEGPQKLPAPDEKEQRCTDSFFLEYNPDIVPTLLEELQETHASIESLIIAGEGEPTLRLTELLELVRAFKTIDGNEETTIRLTTNGLVNVNDDIDNDNDNDNDNGIARVAESLHQAGVSHISVALMTANADQYNTELMQPVVVVGRKKSNTSGHDTVCQFIREALRAGLQVETTAVDRPDVDKEATEALSRELQVTTPVRWRPYFG
jgi:molybdenum cofactor biosynthesis enzyme MoaA